MHRDAGTEMYSNLSVTLPTADAGDAWSGEVRHQHSTEEPCEQSPSGAAEQGEGRTVSKGDMATHHTHRTQSRARVSQGLRRIRQEVCEHPSQRLTALCRQLTVDCLGEESFEFTRS